MIKFVYQPTKPYPVTQYFGENLGCVDIATGKKVIACNGLNPPEGYKSIYSNMKGHNGLDSNLYSGQPVYACQDGYVEEVQTEEARGLGIGIITKDKYYCIETGKDEFFKIRYWHLKSILVNKGQYVEVGDLIGLGDNTGYSAGNHLHLEMKPVKFINQKSDNTYKGIVNIIQNNGYYGAVDIMPYMDNIYAKDFGGIIQKFKVLLDLAKQILK